MDYRLAHRIGLLILSLSYFSISYLAAATLASQQSKVNSYLLTFDNYQVFIDWMIIPYSTSILFYCYSFIGSKNFADVTALLAKLSWAVFIACSLFVFFPAKFSTPQPEIHGEFFALWYSLLWSFDSPFNQAPSLHVIFCVIFYSEFKKFIRRQTALRFLQAWLVLVALSTWFTYQHHSIDIISGVIVGLGINYAIKNPQHISASILLMISGISLIVARFVQQDTPLLALAAYYLWLSLALISLIYQYNQPKLLGKSQASFSVLGWLCFAPYLLAYKALWSINNLIINQQSETTSEATSPCAGISWITDKLQVGPRLTQAKLACLPNSVTMIDLSAEVAEIAGVPSHQYKSFPMLDLQTPCFEVMTAAAREVNAQLSNQQAVYLHCAMGYSRSFLIAAIYLVAYKNYSVTEAKDYLETLNHHMKLPQSYISDNDLRLIAQHCTLLDINIDFKDAIYE